MTYRILAHYYYYQGTWNAPEDGYLWSDPDHYLEFDSHETALDWLEENCGKMELCKGKATYVPKGTYYLNHGEYERPMYTIVHFKDERDN